MPKPRWLTRRRKTEAELPYQPPVWLGDWSNGEIYHRQTAVERRAHDLILKQGEELARYYGMERREFMASGLGMALSMSVLNLVQGCSSSKDGGFFPDPNLAGSGGASAAGSGGVGARSGAVTAAGSGGRTAVGAAGGGAGAERSAAGSGGSSAAGTPAASAGSGGRTPPGDIGSMMTDPKLCEKMLSYDELFIFDIQTHRVARANATYRQFLSILPQGQCGKSLEECFSADEYTQLFFLESDTTVTVLSGIPAVDGNNP